jgi:charged multivesicular body protein 2A
MGVFGSKLTPEEMLRENKKLIRKATRELERERMGLERQEKELIAKIKKAAKDGQMVRASFAILFRLHWQLLLAVSG